jgi:D-alanyl-D-alanine carboxypeptidase
MKKSQSSYFISVLVAIAIGAIGTFLVIEGGERLVKYVRGVPFEKIFVSVKSSIIAGVSKGFTFYKETVDDGVREHEIEEEGSDGEIISQFSDLIYPSDSVELDIRARTYVALDLETGKIFAAFEDDRAVPIASITKLVTAVVAMERMDRSEHVEITGDMLQTYGSSGRLREGEKLRVGELLYPLLMVSSNDASEAIARHYGRRDFIKAMNEWAQSVGAYQTYFIDPSGLSKYNVSTAKDLAIISRAIYKKYPEIFDITNQKTQTVRVHTWTNPTHFLNLSAYAGGKNGFTNEAGRTSISIFSIGEEGDDRKKSYAVIVLGSNDRDRDIMNLLNFMINSRT